MQNLVIACQKGGVGKSTLAVNLLLECISRGINSAIYDTDPQGSCLLMSQQRQRIHGQALPVLSGMPQADMVIIDTAPHANAELSHYIKQAGLILIPTRPAVLDLTAAATTIQVAKRYSVPTAVVLMLPAPRSPEILEARDWVKEQGVECAGVVHHRVDIARAAGEGLALFEMHPNHPGVPEFKRVADYCFNILAS